MFDGYTVATFSSPCPVGYKSEDLCCWGTVWKAAVATVPAVPAAACDSQVGSGAIRMRAPCAARQGELPQLETGWSHDHRNARLHIYPREF